MKISRKVPFKSHGDCVSRADIQGQYKQSKAKGISQHCNFSHPHCQPHNYSKFKEEITWHNCVNLHHVFKAVIGWEWSLAEKKHTSLLSWQEGVMPRTSLTKAVKKAILQTVFSCSFFFFYHHKWILWHWWTLPKCHQSSHCHWGFFPFVGITFCWFYALQAYCSSTT